MRRRAAALVAALAVSGCAPPRPTPPRSTVVVAGSSIALGYLADGPPWPDLLRGARVVNASIGATRLLRATPAGPSLLAREPSLLDALSAGGTVVLTDLINDIQQEPHEYDPQRLEAGVAAFVRAAHRRGVRVVAATIPPFGGYPRWAPDGEACRRAVNGWLHASGVPDRVVDLDAVLRDPADPVRLAARFDAGDHLHVTEAGQQAIASAVQGATPMVAS